MTITINWEAVAALIALLLAFSAFFTWFVRSAVRDEFEKRDELYVPSAKSTLTGAEIQRRLERLEAELPFGQHWKPVE